MLHQVQSACVVSFAIIRVNLRILFSVSTQSEHFTICGTHTRDSSVVFGSCGCEFSRLFQAIVVKRFLYNVLIPCIISIMINQNIVKHTASNECTLDAVRTVYPDRMLQEQELFLEDSEYTFNILANRFYVL